MIKGNEIAYLTLEGLVEKFNVFKELREVTQYDITENFTKHGERKYTLFNLTGEIEDIDGCKMAIFTDAEEELQTDITRVLNAFLDKSIFEIAYSCENHVFEVELVFIDGTINIVAHNE